MADIAPFEVADLRAALVADKVARWPSGAGSALERILPGGRNVEVPVWVIAAANQVIGASPFRIVPKGFISPPACRAALRNWAAGQDGPSLLR